MKKKKIEIKEVDGKIAENVIHVIVQDALIDILVKKKLITEKELQRQIQKNCKMMNKDMDDFMKENPEIVHQIQEEIKRKQQEQEKIGSYIG